MDSSEIAARWGLPDGAHVPGRVIGRQGESSSRLAFNASGTEHLVQCLIELRRRLAGDAARTELVDEIEAGILHLKTTLDTLLRFTSGRKPKLAWVNLRQIVDDVCDSLRAEIQAQRVDAITDVPRHLGIVADREMLRSAIANLVSNALDAMPRGGRLVITSFIGRRGLELEVADSGPGLSEEVLDQVFEPFFTTKSEAAGMGLAIVHRIAEAHGGEVLAANCPEGGAAFTLRLPQRMRNAA